MYVSIFEFSRNEADCRFLPAELHGRMRRSLTPILHPLVELVSQCDIQGRGVLGSALVVIGEAFANYRAVPLLGMEQVADAEADVQLFLEEGFAQGDFPDYILVEAGLSPVGRTSVAAGELQGEVQGQVHRSGTCRIPGNIHPVGVARGIVHEGPVQEHLARCRVGRLELVSADQVLHITVIDRHIERRGFEE